VEQWNDGIMGFGEMEKWVTGTISFGREVKKVSMEINSLLNSTFHYSTIPLFHVRSRSTGLEKIPLFSIGCRNSDTFSYSPLIFLIILGIKKEKINRAIEKKTLKEISSAQFPDVQTSFIVPMKNVKINVPTMIPRPVPIK